MFKLEELLNSNDKEDEEAPCVTTICENSNLLTTVASIDPAYHFDNVASFGTFNYIGADNTFGTMGSLDTTGFWDNTEMHFPNLPSLNTWYDYNGEYPRVSEALGPSLANPLSDVPISLNGGSFSDIVGQAYFDSGIQGQADMNSYGFETSNPGFENDSSNTYLPSHSYVVSSDISPSSYDIADDHNMSGSSTMPSHEGSHSPSDTPESGFSNSGESSPGGSSPEPGAPAEEEREPTLCFGMLHNLDVKLVGEMPIVHDKLRSGETAYQRFKLKTQDDHVILCFPDEEIDFGYLRSSTARTLTPLISDSNVELEPIAERSALRDIIERANKPTDAMVKVDINLYGPERVSSTVGDTLSSGKLWLQRSDHSREDCVYENPHFLRIETRRDDAQVLINPENAPNDEAPKNKRRKDALQRMVEDIYKSIDNNRRLNMVEGGTRVTQRLLEHQQEALGFMLERESGHINDKYRLWWEVRLEDGTTKYRHRITKVTKSVRPEEKGGGILADEMGMGKSLSILALVMKTLDNGQEWADQRNKDHENRKSIRCSRSTLIVASSALLIMNWDNEIRKHLEGGLTVIKYHGHGRQRDLAALENSDIILTTYSTLAAEYQRRRSPLHRIEWYRVVLDEAHVIRRPSTTFNRACLDLRAVSRWCLTGTPIQNKLADIGTLFTFIRAEPFNNAAVFRKWIETAFEQMVEDPQKVKDRLVMLLEAFCLRRTKDMLHLPNVKQFIRSLEFSPGEREQYEKTEQILLRRIKNRVGEIEKNSKFGLFQMKLQLRILCNHGTWQKSFSWHRRSLFDEKEAVLSSYGRYGEILCSGCEQPMPILGSSLVGGMFEDNCAHVLCSECLNESSTSEYEVPQRRCPLCMRWRQDLIAYSSQSNDDEGQGSGDVDMSDAPTKMTSAEGDHDNYFNTEGHSTKMTALIEDVRKDLQTTKSIIFSCWTRTLHLVSRHLKKAAIPFLQIDGDCPPVQRQARLNTFADSDEMPVLIMTTGTGAFGLNVTCANRIFIVELQWNPSVENQAIARAIRLGQTSEVRVMRYVIKDTVEEEMRQQQQYKKAIAAMGFEETPDLIDMENSTY